MTPIPTSLTLVILARLDQPPWASEQHVGSRTPTGMPKGVSTRRSHLALPGRAARQLVGDREVPLRCVGPNRLAGATGGQGRRAGQEPGTFE